MNELVTVCITTYNRKNFLPLSLKSILTQTYKNIEIIIVDDFSNDGTQELIENELLNLDIRIKYIRHKKNKGLAAARNTAIYNGKGKYFSFCDDDDLWHSDFVEKFVETAKNFNDQWCFCCGETIKEDNLEIKRNYNQPDISLKEAILKGYVPPCAAQFYFTSTLKKINGYNEMIKSGVDHDLWLALSYKNINLHFLPYALAMPNRNDDYEKMTNNFDKRNHYINDSLIIWKKNFINEYGEEIYKNFCIRYKYEIFKSFLIRYVKNKKFIQIIKIFLYKKNIFFTPMIIYQILIWIFKKKNSIIIRPEFKISKKSLIEKLNFFLIK
jgi:glycosyltransferase involved in cell wall biosynthesis